jgi:type IV pilus assembly protein PilX
MGTVMSPNRIFPPPRRQRGAALVVGLIFLVLISLIATIGMRQSITQERMAGGLRNDSLARNSAETALRAGERWIYDWYLVSNGTVLRGDEAATQGVFNRDAVIAATFRQADPVTFFAVGANALPTGINDYTGSSNYTARLAEQPVFLTEDLGRVRPQGAGTAMEGGATGTENYEGSGGGSPVGNSDLYIFRITGRATGGLETVVRTVESTYIARAKG